MSQRLNKLVETQLSWLKDIGFTDVDYWKWLELALLVGVKPLTKDKT